MLTIWVRNFSAKGFWHKNVGEIDTSRQNWPGNWTNCRFMLKRFLNNFWKSFSKCCREKTSLSATVEPLQMALVRLVNLSFYQLVILSTCHFVKLPFYQLAILSTCHFINLAFCQLGILSTWHFMNMTFYQLGILSTWHFINLTFYQLGILLTWQFCQLVCFQFANLSTFHLVILPFRQPFHQPSKRI